MSSERSNLYNELSSKSASVDQFNRDDRRFKLDIEYIKESSVASDSNNLVIESSLNNIQMVVPSDKKIELFGIVDIKETINLTAATLTADSSFLGMIEISNELLVREDVSLNASVDISNNLNVYSIFVKEDISINNDVKIGKNLVVDSILVFNDVSINGDVSLNSNVDILNKLVVTGDVSINENLTLLKHLDVFGDVSLNENVKIGKELEVIGDVSLNSKVDISNNLYVNGDVSFQRNLDISGQLITTILKVLGDVSFDGFVDISNRLVINGDASFIRNVEIDGILDISNRLIVAGDVSLNNKLDVSNNVNLKNNLIVLGDVSLNKAVDIVGDLKINNLLAEGDVSLNGDVDIEKLFVYKNVDISNDLYVNGDVSFQRNLDVSGKLITTILKVLNDVSLNGNVDILNRLVVSNDVSLNGNVDISNKLLVLGDVSFTKNLDISNNLNVSNKLIVLSDVSLNKNVTIKENLNIDGNILANDATLGDFSSSYIKVNENLIALQKDIDNTIPVKIRIGSYAGRTGQGENGIALGLGAGSANQNSNGISIGENAGRNNQGSNSIAIGSNSSFQDQGNNSISIGNQAGNDSQSSNSIAIGNLAGQTSQKSNSIGLGYKAGNENQGIKTIAIGYEAGSDRQGNNSIAIGNQAGVTQQAENSIIINATNSQLNSNSGNSGLYINPIRNDIKKNIIQYDNINKELTYGTEIDISGSISSGDISCVKIRTSGLIDTQNNDLSMGSGNIECNRISSQEISIEGDVSLNLNADIAQDLKVYGNTNLLNRLDVSNDVSLNSSVSIINKLNVDGDVSLNSSLTILNDLVVANNVNISKKLVVGTDVSFIGNVDILGQLGTSALKMIGDVSFSENLDVEKRFTVSNDTSLNGSCSIENNLRVGGRGTIMSDVSLNNNVSIGGRLDIIDETNLSGLNATGDVSINENLKVGKKLIVENDVSLNSSVSIINKLNVDGDVSLNGDVYIQDGNINVGNNKTLDISGGTLILRDNQISGDKINGGSIDEIRIVKLTGGMDSNNQEIINVNISGGSLDYISISNSNIELSSNNIIDISAATLILSDKQISGDKISGGSIDEIRIEKLTGSMDGNNQQISNVNISGGIINNVSISNSNIELSSNNIIDISAATLILSDKQISGDKISGGTIDDISISKIGGMIDFNNQIMINVNISGGIINGTGGTPSNTIYESGVIVDMSAATLLLSDDQISGDKINGGTIDEITISKLLGMIDFNNQIMTNVNISGGTITGAAGTPGNTTYVAGTVIDMSEATIVFGPNQITGDSIYGGTIDEIAISKLLGPTNCNTQAMANVNIVSGNITGVTINGTINAATLGGSLNANHNYISNVNIDSGDISNVLINANSYGGSGIITNLNLISTSSKKLATAGAIKSYVDNNGGGSGSSIVSGSDASFGSVDVAGILRAGTFIGNGSNLTGILQNNNDASFTNVDITNNLNIAGEVSLNQINLGGHIIPTTDSAFDIGSSTRFIRDFYLSTSTFYMGSASSGIVKPIIKLNGGKAEFTGSLIPPSDVSSTTKMDALEASGNVIFTNNESRFDVMGDVSFNNNLDVGGNIEIAGDLSGTTASLKTITLKGENGEAFINGPPDIYIDPILEGYPINSGRVIIRGSLQTLGSVTSVGVENIDVSSSNIIINAYNPVVPGGGVIVRDQYDISRGILWKNSPHNKWDISDNLHLGSKLEVEKDVSINSNLDVTGIIKGTLGTANQTNITSVGTLTGLSMGGNIDLGGYNVINGGTMATTLTTSAQPNITSVGTLQGASFSSNINLGGNQLINVSSIEGILTTGVQTNITKVGILTGLSMEGDLDLCGQNITNVSNLAGTLTTNAQPNITSLGELTGLKIKELISGKTGINLGNNDISDVDSIYTTTTNAVNVIATGSLIGLGSLQGTITTEEQPNITRIGRLNNLDARNIDAENIVVSHITFSGDNLFIDGGDVSINQTLDVSALIVKKLTISGDAVTIKATDISLIGVLDIVGDISATRFSGDGSLLTNVGAHMLKAENDGSFSNVDVSGDLIVKKDISANGDIKAKKYYGDGSSLSGVATISDNYVNSSNQTFFELMTTQPKAFDTSGIPTLKSSSKVNIEWNYDNIIPKTNNVSNVLANVSSVKSQQLPFINRLIYEISGSGLSNTSTGWIELSNVLIPDDLSYNQEKYKIYKFTKVTENINSDIKSILSKLDAFSVRIYGSNYANNIPDINSRAIYFNDLCFNIAESPSQPIFISANYNNHNSIIADFSVVYIENLEPDTNGKLYSSQTSYNLVESLRSVAFNNSLDTSTSTDNDILNTDNTIFSISLENLLSGSKYDLKTKVNNDLVTDAFSVFSATKRSEYTLLPTSNGIGTTINTSIAGSYKNITTSSSTSNLNNSNEIYLNLAHNQILSYNNTNNQIFEITKPYSINQKNETKGFGKFIDNSSDLVNVKVSVNNSLKQTVSFDGCFNTIAANNVSSNSNTFNFITGGSIEDIYSSNVNKGFRLKSNIKLNNISNANISNAIGSASTNVYTLKYEYERHSDVGGSNSTNTYNIYVDNYNQTPSISSNTNSVAVINVQYNMGIPSVDKFSLNMTRTYSNINSQYMYINGDNRIANIGVISNTSASSSRNITITSGELVSNGIYSYDNSSMNTKTNNYYTNLHYTSNRLTTNNSINWNESIYNIYTNASENISITTNHYCDYNSFNYSGGSINSPKLTLSSIIFWEINNITNLGSSMRDLTFSQYTNHENLVKDSTLLYISGSFRTNSSINYPNVNEFSYTGVSIPNLYSSRLTTYNLSGVSDGNNGYKWIGFKFSMASDKSSHNFGGSVYNYLNIYQKLSTSPINISSNILSKLKQDGGLNGLNENQVIGFISQEYGGSNKIGRLDRDFKSTELWYAQDSNNSYSTMFQGVSRANYGSIYNENSTNWGPLLDINNGSDTIYIFIGMKNNVSLV